jgi:hypothetical protein
MKLSTPALFVVLAALAASSALGQAAAPPGFKVLPRPIHYETPLGPAGGPSAVIVYGADAPWSREAAEAVQKAIQEWSGVTLALADDRAVTDEKTWLVADAYRRTPLVVLGNAQDNRVMHALGTRYLLQSNRTWPGGDRFIVRGVFEPFVADVNYIVLEASNAAGMAAAVAKFEQLLQSLPKSTTATLPPRLRLIGGGKDRWREEHGGWKVPAEWAGCPDKSASELARSYQGRRIVAGWESVAGEAFPSEITTYVVGYPQQRGVEPTTVTLEPGRQRAIAAMCLLGCRALGGRAFTGGDHYGAMRYVCALRAIFQAGILTEQEFNEFESALALAIAYPGDHFYESIAEASRMLRNRHGKSCLLTSVQTLDYVLNHCRLDPATRREAQRRYEGARRTAAQYVESFRDPCDDNCLGETTMCQFYALLHEGLMENVRNGMLRNAADMYILTSDNVLPPGWGWGCYAGLAGFTSGPAGMKQSWLGGSLVAAAAFYYDDPQYRWLARNRSLPLHSEATSFLGMHGPSDTVGAVEEPSRYYGVHAVPFDRHIYGLLADRELLRRAQVEGRLPPPSLAKAIDRLAFRDGFKATDAYLYLAASQDLPTRYPAQNNSIARFSDLGDTWLFTNTTDGTTWSRSTVSLANGKSFTPRAGCTLEAMANLGEISAATSKEQGVAGADWTRTIVHWRGHYFAVLDKVEAGDCPDFRDHAPHGAENGTVPFDGKGTGTFCRPEGRKMSQSPVACAPGPQDQLASVCRWRMPQAAVLKDGVCTATAVSGNALRIQNTEPLFQTLQQWPIDGYCRPYVLEQYKHPRLAKGGAATYQNLLYASGANRPDDFEARRLGPTAMLVKGRTAAGPHLALIGIGGGIPLDDYKTDAAIFHIVGNRMHLAAATTLQAKIGGSLRTIYEASKPVNLMVDVDTGRGEIDLDGNRRLVAFATAGVLPRIAEALESLWKATPATPPRPAVAGTVSRPVFHAKSAEKCFQRPLRNIANVRESFSRSPSRAKDVRRTWFSTDKLEITLALPKTENVACVRLVSAGGSYFMPHEGGDFRFSLVLSNDHFQHDRRTSESPDVKFEETPAVSVGHYCMERLPTWNIQVGATATEIKIVPRATTRERPALSLGPIEVYADQRIDDLAITALAADIDGDGSNELVVGTSEGELAAYDAEAARLWHKRYRAQIYQMDAADLDQRGKSETLVYLTSEELRRVNGDGSERPVGDLCQAQVQFFKESGHGAISTMAAWGPDDVKHKEVLLWAEACFRALPDGAFRPIAMGQPLRARRLVNLVPNEPEAMATLDVYDLNLWSARRDSRGNYIALGSHVVTGANCSTTAGAVFRGFAWIEPINAGKLKGVLTAAGNGVNYVPVAAFSAKSKESGWSFNTGGTPITAALLGQFHGRGAAVFVGRQDGFVNVFRVADGSMAALASTGEPIIGMAFLAGPGGGPLLAVGTKFGVHLFDADMKPLGKYAIAAAAFAGPGGKSRDRLYVVDAGGKVTVLILNLVRRRDAL